MRKTSYLFVLLSIVLVGLSACGNKEEDTTSGTTKTSEITTSTSEGKVIFKSDDSSNGEIIFEDSGMNNNSGEIKFKENN